MARKLSARQSILRDIRRSKKKSKKKSNAPALTQLRYLFLGSGAATANEFFIDVAAGLSLTNRRLYAQGKDYHIKSVKSTVFMADPGATYVSQMVATAMPSWVTYAAWRKAKHLHTVMQSGRGGAPGSGLPGGVTAATWHDFKVYLSKGHYQDRANFRVPENADGSDASEVNSEWVYSQFTSPKESGGDDEFSSHLIGDDSGSVGSFASVGIIKGYQESRRTVEQDGTGNPIDVNDSWMIQLFDDGDTLDEIAANLVSEGDLPPYDSQDYPGGETNMPGPMTRHYVLNNISSPGQLAVSCSSGAFNAPCGLIRLDLTTDSTSQVGWICFVMVDVVPGSYKGVKALSM